MVTTKERKERLEKLLKIIRDQGDSTTVDTVFHTVGIEWGVRRRTLEGYLDSLESAGLIKRPQQLINFAQGSGSQKIIVVKKASWANLSPDKLKEV